MRSKAPRRTSPPRSAQNVAAEVRDHLRASTVTWMAVRRDTTEQIWQRVGHEDWKTMRKYLRVAEALAEGFGVPFPPLPQGLIVPPESSDLSSESNLSCGKNSGADGTRTRGLRRDSAEILPGAAPVYEPNGQFVDSCFGAAIAYLRAAEAGAIELPQLAALIEGVRYSKIPLLGDLCRDIVEALRCGELELATSRGLRLATGAVQLGALLSAKTGTTP